MAVNLLIVYARSGGTLLNQCLAAMPDTVVISEVHRLRAQRGVSRYEDRNTIWGQAKQWYGITLKADDFTDAILELEQYCAQQQLSLIVRDWTFASFTPCPENQFNPARQLETYLQLSQKTELRSFALVRNSIDVWISRGRPPLDDFDRSYGAYIQELLQQPIKIYKYEALCAAPDATLQQMCAQLGIDFDPHYKEHYLQSKVNGDTQAAHRSRGRQQGLIAPLGRKFILPHHALRASRSEVLKRCNTLLDYEQQYFTNENGWREYILAGVRLLNQKLKF